MNTYIQSVTVLLTMIGFCPVFSADEKKEIVSEPEQLEEAFAGAFGDIKSSWRSVSLSEYGEPIVSLSISFETGSDQPSSESEGLIASLASEMKKPEFNRFIYLIEGHSDSRGSSESNLRLSDARASVVRDVLVDAGVNPEILLSAGKGEYFPIAEPEVTEEDLAANRRVVIRFVGIVTN